MSPAETATSPRGKTYVHVFGSASALFLLGALLLIFFACSTNAYAQVPVYTVTDLGVISGDDASVATSINNKGDIAGYSYLTTASGSHPFVWSNGVLTNLAPGSTGRAFSINDSGQIAGLSPFSGGGCFPAITGRPVVWQNGGMTDLSTTYHLGGDAGCFVNAYINNLGQAVGSNEHTVGTGDAHYVYLFDTNGSVTTAGDLGLATHINDKSQVVGQVCPPGSGCFRGAALWQSGKTTLLASGGIAYDVNDSGQVVGSIPSPNNHATLWINGTATDLGTLGGPGSDARAINSLGQIVGSSNTSTGGTDAFIYLSGSMIDLNKQIFDPNWQLTSATGINDAGQVVGTGTHLGQTRAFLLTPFTGITPNHGGNAGSVTATVVSAAIQAGTTVRLTAPGQPDIVGNNTTTTKTFSTIVLQTTFDLTGSAPGLRDVILTQPDGTTITIPGGFTIDQGGGPDIKVDIVGADTFRAGTRPTYYVIYRNNGNVDAGPTAISFSFPPVLAGNVVSAPGPSASDVSEEGDSVISIGVPIVPVDGGGVGVLQLSVVDPSSVQPHEKFEFSAWADPLPLDTLTLSAADSPRVSVDSSALVSASPALCPIFPTCLNLFDGTLECQTRQFLARQGIRINNCPCDFNCTIVCSQPFKPPSCKAGCTNVAGLNLSAILHLLQFKNTKTFTCDLTITGATECDHHSRGRCGHYRGYSVDLLADTCLTTFIHKTCPNFQGLNCTTGGILYHDETSGGHWHLQFPDHGSTCDGTAGLLVDFTTSNDPNGKAGSPGAGVQHYLSGQQVLPYNIFFENLATATASAQQVVITDPLPTTNTDLSTLVLGPVVLGSNVIVPPPGANNFSTDVDLRPSQNLIVRINAAINLLNGQLVWRFTSIDPATGLPTTDPSVGFLPPNTSPPRGQGSAFFSIKPKPGLITDTQIQNQASVVFDQNAPVSTGAWLNTIDNNNPASRVESLPSTEASTNFEVRWSGTDVGSGVRSFTVYSSDNGGAFIPFTSEAVATSATFIGQPGHTYGFFSQARDFAGNLEPLKTKAEATTTVRLGGPPTAKCQNVTVSTDPGVCTASSASVDNGSSDPDGDAVTVSQTPPPPYPLGTTAVTLIATDTEKLSSTCNASVTVVDKQPPTISVVSASPNVIWPPNEKMIPVTVSVSASDNCDQNPVCKITGITSNESISSSDAQITGNLSASLQAQRLGSGAGRTYTLAIQCTDASGNSAAANATVTVPHDQGS
jgi:probable HAF family extracellular repeat protein